MALEERVGRQLKEYFANKPDVVAAIVFGSAARGEARPDSDIDVGVLLTRDAARQGVNRSQLIADIMGLLGQNNVDVVILNEASPLLLHRVIRDGHVVHTADSEALAEFTIRAIQLYEDTKPLRELERQHLRRRVEAIAAARGARR